ncbi:MAG: hypothetical protein QM783_10980 [Phycisphaerales bacterium]
MTKRLHFTVIAAAIAAVVLTACLLAPLAFPRQWRETSWSKSLGGSEAFVARDGEPAHRLLYGFQFEPISDYVQYAVRVTIEIGEYPPWTTTESPPQREAALERIRTAFIKDCNDSALPELSGLFGTAWDSPDHATVYEYPRRRLANGLLWAAVVGRWIAAVVLAAAVLAMLQLVPRWLAIRRRDRYGLCLHCGYDLSGTTTGQCPECGK